MEALAAFGVACNVMQTLNFALEAASCCKNFYEGNSPTSIIELHRDGLEQATARLQLSLAGNTSVGDDGDKQLHAIATDLIDIAQELKKELGEHDKRSNISWVKAISKTTRHLRKRHKIERLDTSLRNNQKIMETYILIGLRGQTGHIQDAIQNVSDGTKRRLQDFLQHIQAGNSKLDQMIDRASGDIKSVTVDEGKMTRAHMDIHGKAIQDALAVNTLTTKAYIEDSWEENISAQVLEAQTQAFIQSFGYTQMNDRQNAYAINDIQEGTFQWIFDDIQTHSCSSFSQWISSNSKMYWISGKPGSGKSSLIRFLTTTCRTNEYLNTWRANCDILSAFIWNAGSPMQRSQIGLLATLLHQLLSIRVNTARHLRPQYSKSRKNSITDWSLPELLDCLVAALGHDETPVCMFIDGLDEIDSQEYGGSHGLLKIVGKIAALSENIKICVGSREEPIFVAKMGSAPHLRLQYLTRLDIEKHVGDTLQSALTSGSDTSSEPLNDAQINRLTLIIAEKSNGVFLWANLVTKSILRGLFASDDWNQLQRRIKQLPDRLGGLYTEMWNRVNEGDRQLYRAESALYFRILLENESVDLFSMLLASKPSVARSILSGGSDITEEYVIKQCRTFQQQLTARSACFLEWSVTTPGGIFDKVSFIHGSARDWLKDTLEGLDILHYERRTSAELRYHMMLAKLSYLLLTIKEKPNLNDTKTLLWDILHLNSSLAPELEIPLLDLIASTLERLPDMNSSEVGLPFVKIGAFTGLVAYVKKHLQSLNHYNLTQMENLRNDLLAWACRHLWQRLTSNVSHDADTLTSTESLQSIHLISWLLSQGANCNLPPLDLQFLVSSSGICQSAFVTFALGMNAYLERASKASVEVTAKLLECLGQFLEHKADTRSRIIVAVGDLDPLVRAFGSCWKEFQTYGGTVSERAVVLVEMRPCHIFRYVRKPLNRWIDNQISDPDRKKRLEGFLNDGDIGSAMTALGVRIGLENQTFRCCITTITGTQEFMSVPDMPADEPEEDTCNSGVEEAKKLEDDGDDGIWMKDMEEAIDDIYETLEVRETMRDEEIISWLVDRGHIPLKISQSYTAAELLYVRSFKQRPDEPINLSQIDWSYKPEYDTLVEAMEHFFGPKRGSIASSGAVVDVL